jgi:hypothetical protein
LQEVTRSIETGIQIHHHYILTDQQLFPLPIDGDEGGLSIAAEQLVQVLPEQSVLQLEVVDGIHGWSDLFTK